MEDMEDMEGSGACRFMKNGTGPTFERNGDIYEDTPNMRFLSWIRVLIFSTIIGCEKIANSLQKMFDIVGHSFKGPLSFYDNGMIFIINDFQKDFNIYGKKLCIIILRDAKYDSSSRESWTEMVSTLTLKENKNMECDARYATCVEKRPYNLICDRFWRKTTFEQIKEFYEGGIEYYGGPAYPNLITLKGAMNNQYKQSLMIAILVSRREGRKRPELRVGLWLPSELWDFISANFCG